MNVFLSSFLKHIILEKRDLSNDTSTKDYLNQLVIKFVLNKSTLYLNRRTDKINLWTIS